MSIRGWSMWLMRMRLAMVSRRRSSLGVGGGGWGHGGILALWGSVLGWGVTGGGIGGGEALPRCQALLHPLSHTWRCAYSSFNE